jgi:endonuclease/exonuclease/phosphatase family metal-dependent hydrolase
LSIVQVSVGTFNLNNLFSRFNFAGDVGTSTSAPETVRLEQRTSFAFDDPSGFKLRTYRGQLVEEKPAADRAQIAARIERMNLDVLAVQEAEDVDTLRRFNRDDLGGLYREIVLIEGNDPRLIDVGVLSKLPIGAVTSWQHVPDPEVPGEPLFSRDLLQVEILNATRRERLLTLFNNHLKSHFVPFDTPDPEAEEARANELRRRQCVAAAAIVAAQMRPNSRFLVLGDLNDPPDSPFLAPLVGSPALKLSLGLANAQETRPGPGNPPPPTTLWTERFKASGQPPVYTLMDQVWLSPALAPRLAGAFIERRKKVGGDGSDHDPAWVTLEL